MAEQLRTVPWYDRNPKPIIKSWSGDVAPHALTSRWEYTVPSERMAMLELAQISIIRTVASTDDQSSYGTIKYHPKGGTVTIMLSATIIGKAAGTKNYAFIGQSTLMFPEDILYGFSFDDLTGDGQTNMHISAKLSEFDAYPIEALPFEVELPRVDRQQPEKKPWWWPF